MSLSDLLNKNYSLYVVATGAGVGIQKAIWEIPGCSTFFKGASFPYSSEDSVEFAGGVPPEKFVSQEFAIDLAMAAYRRAVTKDHGLSPIGLAVTASVSSLVEHRGEHCAYFCCISENRVQGGKLSITKGVGREDRFSDGNLVDLQAVEVLLETMFGENRQGRCLKFELVDLTEQARKRFLEYPAIELGRRQKSFDFQMTLFPGAYNPPHEGHETIIKQLNTGGASRVVPTICVNPPHKPHLGVQDMLRRAKLLEHHPILFTVDDPYYIDKARKFPKASLVMGADALSRVFDPQWGHNLQELFDEFESLGTKFFLFGREVNGVFVSAKEVISFLPQQYRRLFYICSGRWDISSTQIRRKHALSG